MAAQRPLHVCHVAKQSELELIIQAKALGYPITCEVCPHHLFLSKDCNHGLGENKSQVRPCLATEEDRLFLLNHLEHVDTFGSDHAPHTLDEKLNSSPPGFPGLETMLPLMLTLVNQGYLTLDDLKAKMHTNPKKIFNLPDQEDTFIEVDLDEEWIIADKPTFCKAGWTPFAGFPVKGRVKRVVLRGQVVFLDGKLLSQPGFGQNIRKLKKSSPKKAVKIETASGKKTLALIALLF